MLTRYMNEAQNWSTAPVLQQGVFLPWVENLLLAWHQADPVSQKEIDRNNTVYTMLQHNRNPYIDHPEWVYRIWGPTASVYERANLTTTLWLDGDFLRYQRTESTGTARLTVYDTMGGMVSSRTVQGSTGSIPFTPTPGMYIVVLDDEQRTARRVVR